MESLMINHWQTDRSQYYTSISLIHVLLIFSPPHYRTLNKVAIGGQCCSEILLYCVVLFDMYFNIIHNKKSSINLHSKNTWQIYIKWSYGIPRTRRKSSFMQYLTWENTTLTYGTVSFALVAVYTVTFHCGTTVEHQQQWLKVMDAITFKEPACRGLSAWRSWCAISLWVF